MQSIHSIILKIKRRIKEIIEDFNLVVRLEGVLREDEDLDSQDILLIRQDGRFQVLKEV